MERTDFAARLVKALIAWVILKVLQPVYNRFCKRPVVNQLQLPGKSQRPSILKATIEAIAIVWLFVGIVFAAHWFYSVRGDVVSRSWDRENGIVIISSEKEDGMTFWYATWFPNVFDRYPETSDIGLAEGWFFDNMVINYDGKGEKFLYLRIKDGSLQYQFNPFSPEVPGQRT